MNIIVWSKENCSYCVKAKTLLTIKGLEYEERLIGDKWDVAQLLEAVPSAKSVPQIFIDDVYIGGYDDLYAYFDAKMVQS